MLRLKFKRGHPHQAVRRRGRGAEQGRLRRRTSTTAQRITDRTTTVMRNDADVLPLRTKPTSALVTGWGDTTVRTLAARLTARRHRDHAAADRQRPDRGADRRGGPGGGAARDLVVVLTNDLSKQPAQQTLLAQAAGDRANRWSRWPRRYPYDAGYVDAPTWLATYSWRGVDGVAGQGALRRGRARTASCRSTCPGRRRDPVPVRPRAHLVRRRQRFLAGARGAGRCPPRPSASAPASGRRQDHHGCRRAGARRLAAAGRARKRRRADQPDRACCATRPTSSTRWWPPGVRPTAVFGPEHGFRGTAQAGGSEGDYLDPRTGVPVYDAYGATAERSSPRMFRKAGVDTVVFDIADVGARFYTYIWSLYTAMRGRRRDRRGVRRARPAQPGRRHRVRARSSTRRSPPGSAASRSRSSTA